ncbi:putative P-type Ca(2+) transporter [Helianthus anomalus]
MFNVDERVKNIIIFNTFVFCQVVNDFNSRKLENKKMFEGPHKNRLFMGIIGMTKLNWGQWETCIAIATLSWPIGWIVKLIPVPEMVENIGMLSIVIIRIRRQGGSGGGGGGGGEDCGR